MRVFIFISLALLIVIIGVLTSTNAFSNSTGNASAREILNGNPNTDILKLDDLICLIPQNLLTTFYDLPTTF